VRKQFADIVEQGRERGGMFATLPGKRYGRFFIQKEVGAMRLQVIASPASTDVPWDHISISTQTRCPTWEEMCWVKDLFFDEEEAVVQFHPPKSEYVNHHPYCLHLWKPSHFELELPPSIAIGPKDSK
jgi:hypothetical protein